MKVFIILLFMLMLMLMHQAIYAGGTVVPPYSATAAMHYDLIRSSDPTAFVCLNYEGKKKHQVWDKRINGEKKVRMFTFLAYYKDHDAITVAVNNEFGTQERAYEIALPIARSLGRILHGLRKGVGRVAIHQGGKGFHAGGFDGERGQIVLYEDTINKRVTQKHMEESLFHEAVHAALDPMVLSKNVWAEVQRLDQNFITHYARDNPHNEDLAESALLVFGQRANRLPEDVSYLLNSLIPRKTRFISDFIDHMEQGIRESGDKENLCG